MDIVSGREGCATSSCGKSALILLEGKVLCLEHFFAKCYERLDALEPLVRQNWLGVAERQKVKALLEECSNQTLFICLRHEPETNIERSRLLEILLQCGDLELMLRDPLSLAKSQAHALR